MPATPLPIERRPSSAAKGGEVVIVTIDQPDRKVAVLDRALIERLEATLDALGTGMAGFVLASSSRVFVAGADLKEISELTDPQLDEYLAFGQRVYGRISALPCTTVAAINGAALGGGLELAMHCDVLLAQRPADPAKPYQLGLVEATMAIVPGWGGTNMLPARIDPARAILMTARGASMTVNDAAEQGLVESLHDSREALLDAACKRAERPKQARERSSGGPRSICDADRRESARAALARVEPELPAAQAARAVAACVRAGLEHGWKAALDAERRSLIRLRSTDEAAAALKAFFERSAAR